MAKVTLMDYTGYGRSDQQWHAAHMLMFTKSTRLSMDSGLMRNIQVMSESKKLEELEYMAKTIPSSWEFADVTFLITGVSRACAQQITRTRTASFAMQSQRVVDATDMEVVNPYNPEVDPELHATFEGAVSAAKNYYSVLLANDAELQDARGVLPMNSTCNLVAKYNLRSFVDLVRARSSLRVQGEYAEIVRDMKAAVMQAWPWVSVFFENNNDKVIKILEDAAKELGIQTGKGLGWELAKAADLLRK